MLLKFFLNNSSRKIIKNTTNRAAIDALKTKMTANVEKNLCFTKYDKSRLKIIDIGANLSGSKILLL